DEVCMALLRPEPTHRPSLGWVAARLGLDATFARRARPLTLVGRDDVLGVLRAALDAPGGDVVALVGPTGVGKSAVADAVAREQEGAGRVVLRGAARSSERVPFDVLDGVVDDL